MNNERAEKKSIYKNSRNRHEITQFKTLRHDIDMSPVHFPLAKLSSIITRQGHAIIRIRCVAIRLKEQSSNGILSPVAIEQLHIQQANLCTATIEPHDLVTIRHVIDQQHQYVVIIARRQIVHRRDPHVVVLIERVLPLVDFVPMRIELRAIQTRIQNVTSAYSIVRHAIGQSPRALEDISSSLSFVMFQRAFVCKGDVILIRRRKCISARSIIPLSSSIKEKSASP